MFCTPSSLSCAIYGKSLENKKTENQFKCKFKSLKYTISLAFALQVSYSLKYVNQNRQQRNTQRHTMVLMCRLKVQLISCSV